MAFLTNSLIAAEMTPRRHPPIAPIGHSELEPPGLTAPELKQLEAFLRSLSGPLDVGAELLRAPQ
jgi:hypothetical protein